MNITKFGKFTRKLRIDNCEILMDMAKKLSVTPSYLSSVETGKRKVPKQWKDTLIESYKLNELQIQEINNIF